MKNIKLICSSLFVFIFSMNSHAANITIETRSITNGINNNDFVSSWDQQTSAIQSNNVDSFDNFRSGRNSLTHLIVDFTTGANNNWEFQAGLDAHYGAQYLLDGNVLGGRTDDLWWARNWNNSDVFSILLADLSQGAHTLELYWAEKCCDGPSSLRFRNGQTDFQSVSTDNLRAAVPEPSIIVIMLLGMVALNFFHKKQPAPAMLNA